MKFQMESQQNEEKTPSISERKQRKNLKKNEEKQQLQNENEERILKKRGKTTTVLPWITKKQEALFKSLSNNQPADRTTIFSQNAVWNALETFSYAPDEGKTFEAYYRRQEYIYNTDCADWIDAKKRPATSTKARNCGTQQVCILYLTKK